MKYRAAVEEQYTKKSLVEVYEEQYQKIHGVVRVIWHDKGIVGHVKKFLSIYL